MLIAMLLILFGFTKETYAVYCLSLEASFFSPPDKEYIMKYGKKVETTSTIITTIFSSLDSRQSSIATTEDLGRLRILIVRKSDNHEFYITSDGKIIAFNKKYDVEEKIIDDMLNQISCR